jgi:sugar fermentation stimulation protein A
LPVVSEEKPVKTSSLFRNDLEAVFERRPNRFLIIAKEGDREIPCHCPNPGRLIEFFGFREWGIPGIKLILEKREGSPAVQGKNERSRGKKGGPAKAKTDWTVAGLHYQEGVVPFFSARANKAAEELILPEIIPGLREVHGEFTLGNSRFDFLCIDKRGARHLVEVKACSLIEYDVAMFPDAPSSRALKHLEELAALSGEGYRCHVLFVIVHGKPRVFIPNLHTDPLFAAALSRYGRAVNPPASPAAPPDPARGGPVEIHASLLRCNRDGDAVLASPAVPVDLSHGELAAGNGGNYLVILEMPKPAKAEIGALGVLPFKAGWYVYAGSARKNLSNRISRHLRKNRKQKHWHLDYLCPLAKTIKALPFLTYSNLECDLAAALEALGGKGVPRFGSSDCRCKSHLYYFKNSPLQNRGFAEMLFRFRHADSLIRCREEPPGFDPG